MWTSLIGFMGSGKSSATRRLQATSNRPALSLDEAVVERVGASVPEIFVREGEAAFRAHELATLRELDPARPLVLDTGGGIVQTPAAVALLRERGVVIWLDAPWETLRARLEDSDPEARPLIGRLGWTGLEELYHTRRRLYAGAADFRLRADLGTSDQVARRIMLRSLQWERSREEVRR